MAKGTRKDGPSYVKAKRGTDGSSAKSMTSAAGDEGETRGVVGHHQKPGQATHGGGGDRALEEQWVAVREDERAAESADTDDESDLDMYLPSENESEERDIILDRYYVQGDEITYDEDHYHEFKAVSQREGLTNHIAKTSERYINAFLNSDGGVLYFGVRDDGVVHGILFTRKMRDLLRLGIDDGVHGMSPAVDPHLVRLYFVNVLQKQEAQKVGTREATFKVAAKDSRVTSRARLEQFRRSPIHRYVVEVHVRRGPAPVYRTRRDVAYVRMNASIVPMTEQLIRTRLYHGRPADQPNYVSPALIGRDQEIAEIRLFLVALKHVTLSSEALSTADSASPPVSFEASDGDPMSVSASSAPSAGTSPTTDSNGDTAWRRVHSSNSEPLLTHNACILLHGVPLCGKSALANRLMAEFSSNYFDRRFYVDWKGVGSNYIAAIDAMIIVIRSVYPDKRLPDSDAGVRGLYESCFAGLRCILLLENAGSVEQVQGMLPHSAYKCLVLVTSRRHLPLDQGLDGAESLVVKLGPLSPESARELMQKSTRRTLTPDECAALSELSGRLPLAIRIIATAVDRQPHVSPTAFAERLRTEERALFNLLTEHSWLSTSLLTYPPAVREAVFSASVFPTMFDLDGIAAVMQCSAREAEDHVSALIDYSLAEYVPAEQAFMQNHLIRIACMHMDERENRDQHLARLLRFVRHVLGVLQRTHAQLESGSEEEKRVAFCDFTQAKQRRYFAAAVTYCLRLHASGESLQMLAWQLVKELVAFSDLLTRSETERTRWIAVCKPLLEAAVVHSPSRPEQEIDVRCIERCQEAIQLAQSK